MATSVALKTNRSLTKMYLHELYKGYKQPFLKFFAFLPLLGFGFMALIRLIIRLVDTPTTGIPATISPTTQYDLGTQGAFAMANSFLSSYGTIGNIMLAILCSMLVASEYSLGTLKMIATRQPSRVRFVLAKILMATTLVAGWTVSFIVGWFVLAMSIKIQYNEGLGISGVDLENMGKGMAYFLVACLQILIMILFAIAISIKFKSGVFGLLAYILYLTIDNLFSIFGATYANGVIPEVPGWAKPILETLKAINPFLVTSSTNRISMKTEVFSLMTGTYGPNGSVIFSTPLWWAWLVFGLYAIGFVGLALLMYVRRDITD